MNDHYLLWARIVADSKMPSKARLVVLTILLYYDEDEKYLFPSIDTLVQGSALSKKVFIKYLQEAHASGFEEITANVMEQINGR